MSKYQVGNCTITKGREVLNPGREIPDGYFSKEQLESLIAKGHIVEAKAPEPAPEAESKRKKGVEKKAPKQEDQVKEEEEAKEEESEDPVDFQ